MIYLIRSSFEVLVFRNLYIFKYLKLFYIAVLKIRIFSIRKNNKERLDGKIH